MYYFILESDIPDLTIHASCLSCNKRFFIIHVSVVTSYLSTSATLASPTLDNDAPPNKYIDWPTHTRLAWQRPYRKLRFGVHLRENKTPINITKKIELRPTKEMIRYYH